MYNCEVGIVVAKCISVWQMCGATFFLHIYVDAVDAKTLFFNEGKNFLGDPISPHKRHQKVYIKVSKCSQVSCRCLLVLRYTTATQSSICSLHVAEKVSGFVIIGYWGQQTEKKWPTTVRMQHYCCCGCWTNKV